MTYDDLKKMHKNKCIFFYACRDLVQAKSFLTFKHIFAYARHIYHKVVCTAGGAVWQG